MADFPITPKAGQLAVEEAAERPYEQAVGHLFRSHELRLGKEMLENLTKTVGQWWLEQDRSQWQEARAARTAPASEVTAQRCCVFADGVMVHTDGEWHEARVGTVRSEGPDQQVYKSSIARLCGVEELGEDLWRNACRLGYRGASVTAFLADGSHWLWSLADRYFQRAVKIVDFWHVCEHVGACGQEFFGEGTQEARAWSLKVSGTLRAGLVGDALREVEALPARSAAKRKAKHDLVTYLTNNRERMDYPRYEAMGLPVGSGEVEAQCKTLVQTRCKQAGMRWRSVGLEPLLRVRCAVRDGRYERDFGRWDGNLLAWQLRRKRAA